MIMLWEDSAKLLTPNTNNKMQNAKLIYYKEIFTKNIIQNMRIEMEIS